MTICYTTPPPTEDGWYLLEVDSELCIAEATLYSDGEVSWAQVGIDYDVWTHRSDMFNIAVIRKLDLDKIALAPQAGDNAEEPVAWTTQAQLDGIKGTGNNGVMWGEPLPHHPDIPLYTKPVEARADKWVVERLTRPIIGIENRTGLEAFDIMADRIHAALASAQEGEG